MKLQCEICGGALTLQSGGASAVCNNCGLAYSRERLLEILGVSGEPVAVDVQQLQMAVKKYYTTGDFEAALDVVKHILEVSPSDSQALAWYDELQDFRFFDIRNGVLVKYSGRGRHIVIPPCVKVIANGDPFGKAVFNECDSIRTVTIGDNVTEIGDYAFYKCSGIETVTISGSVKTIGKSAFRGCRALRTLTIGEGVYEIREYAFEGCHSLKTVTIPGSVKSIGIEAFYSTGLETVDIPSGITYIGKIFYNDGDPGCPWARKRAAEAEQLREQWQREGKYKYCGGTLKGWWTPHCINCGRYQ